MSRRAMRRWLWAAALLTLPLPYYLGGFEWAPAVRLLFLTALILSVIATEGLGGYHASFALLASTQSLIALGLTWFAAALVAWALERLSPASIRAALVSLVVVGLLGLSLLPIYTTPISSSRVESSLVDLFD